MRWFVKPKKLDGWMAVSLQKNQVCIANVRRFPDARPVVELVGTYPVTGGDYAEPLHKIGKQPRSAHYSCLLDPSEYQMVVVDAPNVPQDELKTAIRWRLKDLLDFHVDDATVDVLDIPVEKGANARQHSMYAIAARNNLIQQRQELFEQAEIPLAAIDIADAAQRNISALLEPEGRGLALLSFSEEGGLLTVTFNQELYLSRRFELPLEQLLAADEERRQACFERVTLELQRSLDHFDRQFHFIAVAKLLLAPLGENIEPLRAYLASNLYLPVELLQLEDVFDIAKVPDLQDGRSQRRYFMTLGAALRQEEAVL